MQLCHVIICTYICQYSYLEIKVSTKVVSQSSVFFTPVGEHAPSACGPAAIAQCRARGSGLDCVLGTQGQSLQSGCFSFCFQVRAQRKLFQLSA